MVYYTFTVIIPWFIFVRVVFVSSLKNVCAVIYFHLNEFILSKNTCIVLYT